MTPVDTMDGCTPKPSLESSHGGFRVVGVHAVHGGPFVAAAPSLRDLSLEHLAAFERRERHPAALRAAIFREQARQEANGKVHREAEAAGQMVLDFENAS